MKIFGDFTQPTGTPLFFSKIQYLLLYTITLIYHNACIFELVTRPNVPKAGRGYQRSWPLWPLGFRVGVGQRTARIASSKTFFRPLVVSAEHSRYLTAPTSLDIARPWKQKHRQNENQGQCKTETKKFTSKLRQRSGSAPSKPTICG